MANEQNLKPIRDSEVARQLQEKSVIKRQENKQQRIIFRQVIEEKLGANIDDIVDAMMIKSKTGDVSAATWLRDTIGQKPKDEVEQKQEVRVVMDSKLEEWGK